VEKKLMNNMDNMEMDKVSGGKISPWHPKAPRPRPSCHDNAPTTIKDVKIIKNVKDIEELNKKPDGLFGK
jgi:hypothetical protein